MSAGYRFDEESSRELADAVAARIDAIAEGVEWLDVANGSADAVERWMNSANCSHYEHP